ncbi:TetR/AcrR family transcriptional regulator [Paraburkholderia sp. J41]|uniref:TetR/AcrR family transcriptional regulator n=1 Tax=Paraburkholderia sp. J41 TaxID=2805433 RepID=UPI002AC354E8|nr:TetR/AcrR family transcriptional regulator [Paraburkholderia sp. J41]
MRSERAKKASAKSGVIQEADQAPSSRVSAILNAAERVFGEHGYAGASMRNIAEEAGVAQALVHYHYASKDKLFEAVFERRSSKINQYRGKLLDDLFSSGRSATVEDVLTIAFTPLSKIFHGEDADNLALYVQLVATISLGSDERSRRVREKYYDPIAERVIDALHTVLPGISHEHATWAYLFSVGARQQAHALNGRAARLGAPERTSKSIAHYEQLVRFAAAGVRALVGTTRDTASKSSTVKRKERV